MLPLQIIVWTVCAKELCSLGTLLSLVQALLPEMSLSVGHPRAVFNLFKLIWYGLGWPCCLLQTSFCSPFIFCHLDTHERLPATSGFLCLWLKKKAPAVLVMSASAALSKRVFAPHFSFFQILQDHDHLLVVKSLLCPQPHLHFLFSYQD